MAAAAAHRALNPPQAPEPEQIPRISASPRPRKIAVAKKATKAEEVVATLVTAAVMAASVVAVAILAAVITITFRCKAAKCQPEKKKQKLKPLQIEFLLIRKILGFISLSKLHRNTNKNQAFLIPKAKKPRPRKASSHLMVETPPQPRARPPLL